MVVLIILSILVPLTGLMMVLFNVGERIAPVSPSTPSEGEGVAQEGAIASGASTVVPVEFKGEDNRKINWKG